MTDKFTPGPWRVVKSDSAIVVCGESEKKTEFGASRYAAIGGFDRSDEDQLNEAIANAALISAAPELLQALENYVNGCSIGIDAAAQARAAIAKARGL